MNFIFLKQNTEKGATAILLTLLILSGIILISTVLTNIFLDEIKISSLVRQSGPAFYAAEAGMEYALYQINQGQDQDDGQHRTEGTAISLSNGSKFWVEWGATTSCYPAGYSICSTGRYLNARRKINITW